MYGRIVFSKSTRLISGVGEYPTEVAVAVAVVMVVVVAVAVEVVDAIATVAFIMEVGVVTAGYTSKYSNALAPYTPLTLLMYKEAAACLPRWGREGLEIVSNNTCGWIIWMEYMMEYVELVDANKYMD